MIGENIKRLRIKCGLTQSELASSLNVSDKTVSSWEINRTEPKMGMIEMICKVLDCTKADIIGSDYDCDYTVKLSDDELLLIEKYRKSDDMQKAMIQRLLAYQDALSQEKLK